jgi:Rieske Fe-S protein
MTISRRTFVKGSLALPVLANAGCGNDVQPAPIVEATVNANPDDLTHYGKIQVPVPMYPDLVPIGGAVMLRVAPLPPGDYTFQVPPAGVLLVHRGTPDDPDEYIATRADCPHQGCPLGYSKKDDLIECPCHSSRFLATSSGSSDPNVCIGRVVHPPANSNLTVYKVTRAGDYVYVDLGSDQSCGASSMLPAVANGTITIPLAMFPSLQNPGGSLVGQPMGLGDTIIVARIDATTVVCTSAICTHLQCHVALNIQEGDFHCPCHDSRFQYDGAVIDGPAPSPLKSYPVAYDTSTDTVTINVS